MLYFWPFFWKIFKQKIMFLRKSKFFHDKKIGLFFEHSFNLAGVTYLHLFDNIIQKLSCSWRVLLFYNQVNHFLELFPT